MKNDNTIHIAFIFMILLTLFTYAVGELAYSGVIAVLVILFTVMIKGSLIIRNFMELKGVALLWKAIMYGWLSTICLAIALAYFISI